MTNVLSHPVQDRGVGIHRPHDRVAVPAQHGAHLARRVVVINHKQARRHVAESALAALQLPHLLNLIRRQVVLAHQPGAEVLLAGSLRVLRPPFTQSLVPTSLVRLRVLASGLVAARLAVRPTRTARHRELGERKGSVALGASLFIHKHSMTWPHDIARRRADQACHADVLLEIANGEASE